MAMDLTIAVRRELDLGWPRDQVFELIADVPRSAGHFPGLRALDDLGDGVYRWRLESFRLKQFSFAVSYAARYVPDPEAGTVVWTTFDDGGNTKADGRWVLGEPSGDRVRLRFENTIQLKLPIPRLLARVAKGVVRDMSERQVDTYLKRISATMEGRVLD